MKKALLSTTALIAGGLIAGSVMAADLEPAPLPAPVDEGFTVEVGGTAFAGFFYADTNVAAPVDQTLVPWTAEIWFTATTTLSNGIQVGVRIELEGMSWNGVTGGATGVSGDQIDEHYIWVSGNFGRFEIGANDEAIDTLYIAGPGYGALGLNGPSFVAIAPTAAPDAARKGFSGDSNSVSYFTPRISGFQAGVTFTPNNADAGGAALPIRLFAAQRNIFSAAANYVNTFNNVNVAFGAGVETAKNTAAAGNGRKTQWTVGARAGMAGFTLGGSYTRDKTTGTFALKDRVWQVSGSYGQGPWTVGAGYLNSKRTSTGAKYRRIGGGASYALGTGVTLTADINHEKRTSAAGVSGKGWLAGVGILTSF